MCQGFGDTKIGKNGHKRKDQKFIYPTSDRDFKYLPKDISIKVGKMKDAYFDVYARLSDGSRAVIEMQNYVRSTFIDRSLVYSASAILEHFTNRPAHCN